MEFTEQLAVAQVTLIPLIMGMIGALKRIIAIHPKGAAWVQNVADDLWFALSLLFGVVFQVVYYVLFVGKPQAGVEWFTLIVLGIAFALAAGKAYDEQKARRNGV